MNSPSDNITGLRLMQLMLDPEIEIITCIFDMHNFMFYNISYSCEKILGYTKAEMINQTLEKFIHKKDYERSLDEARKNKDSESLPGVFINRYIHKNGKTVRLIWISIGTNKDKSISIGIPFNFLVDNFKMFYDKEN